MTLVFAHPTAKDCRDRQVLMLNREANRASEGADRQRTFRDAALLLLGQDALDNSTVDGRREAFLRLRRAIKNVRRRRTVDKGDMRVVCKEMKDAVRLLLNFRPPADAP